MSELQVTNEQAHFLSQSPGVVVIKDQQGKVVAHAFRAVDVDLRTVFSPEQIARAKERSKSKGPWLTTKQVLDHLRSLGE